MEMRKEKKIKERDKRRKRQNWREVEQWNRREIHAY